MTAPKWTEAHRREAWARVFTLTGQVLTQRCGPLRATRARLDPKREVGTEAKYRKGLTRFGFDAARIEREVRRVRALAEGRLVRETGYRAGGSFYPLDRQEEALLYARSVALPCYRTTRIRRAS